ncbi:helix-turn-helix protein [Sinobacterium caligoides]|uniref:Helix-turn-helix protein n=1 Tax=Sinobacterium caligoides TaxID=933926 RepID=A0A3N2DYJ6_9GAMM|nr:AraC family transcriptional regulator [Sinobacterium caligoides]ROS04921.1 helix-turn-helix protein [Sinobacterium caligoides]
MNKKMPLLHPMYGELLLHSAELLGLDREDDAFNKVIERWRSSKSPCDFVLLLNQCVKGIADDSMALAFCYGENLHPSCAGSVGLAMISAPTLGDVFAVIGRYYAITGLAMRYKASSVNGQMRLNVDIEYEGLTNSVRVFFVEALLACWKNGADSLTATNVQCDCIYLDYAEPSNAERYSEYFGCPVEFGCKEISVVFSEKLFSKAVISANPVAYKRSLKTCESALHEYRSRMDYAEKVKACFAESNDLGLLSLEAVASRLNLSPRTLGRYLSSEGTGFQKILEEQKRSHACKLLSSTACSLEKIAESVGYSDLSNFRRAFIRWTGMTPTDYRKNKYLLIE